MKYFLDLFTPETWNGFREHGATISGFRVSQKNRAQQIAPGDLFLCYLTRLSRWCGVLKVTSEPFIDDAIIFSQPDPFVVRFRVEPTIVLDEEHSIPIFIPEMWTKLSVTQDMPVRSIGWAKYFRKSLMEFNEVDGALVVAALIDQNQRQVAYPLSDRDRRQLARKVTVRTPERNVTVEIPEDDEEEPEDVIETTIPAPADEVRESITMQAMIAQIGAKMGFRIWVPRADKNRVKQHVDPSYHSAFVEALPLSYDEVTLKTIEQIDVIWLNGRAMARAFEVEHTTAIYSGLLRMADLLALQPNMDISLHIVAPDEKSEKVKREIKRPVFSLLQHGPLYEKCTYLSYEAVRSLAEVEHLRHVKDGIIEEYEELAEED